MYKKEKFIRLCEIELYLTHCFVNCNIKFEKMKHFIVSIDLKETRLKNLTPAMMYATLGPDPSHVTKIIRKEAINQRTTAIASFTSS